MTLAHTLTYNPVSQFGHWSSEEADTLQNRFTNCLYSRYIVKNPDLAIYTCSDAGAVTMSPSESDSYMVMSYGRYMQG